ncbi:unnamed protein product [Amoebophrya sp. A120]|nr:unnamed protein product [Amoebophrya sp. A120]|eukprot:GSA120T00000382001.1
MDSFLAGVCAGLSTDLLLHPIDHLKCLYQTRSSTAGLRSLAAVYRGFPAVAALGAPGNGVFYLVYEHMRARSATATVAASSSATQVRSGTTSSRGTSSCNEQEEVVDELPAQSRVETSSSINDHLQQILLASTAASVAANLVYCPMEVVKETSFVEKTSTRKTLQNLFLQQQLQEKHCEPAQSRSSARPQTQKFFIPVINILKKIYRGLFFANLTWVPYFAIYFGIYEQLKWRGGDERITNTATTTEERPVPEVHLQQPQPPPHDVHGDVARNMTGDGRRPRRPPQPVRPQSATTGANDGMVEDVLANEIQGVERRTAANATTQEVEVSTGETTALLFADDVTRGLLAGTIAAALTYPVDVLKTRAQAGLGGGLLMMFSDSHNTQSRSSMTEAGSKSGGCTGSTGESTRLDVSTRRYLRLHSKGILTRVVWLAPASALTISFYNLYFSLFQQANRRRNTDSTSRAER